MHVISKIADRMVSAVVPAITASAGCGMEEYDVSCGCIGQKDGNLYLVYKTCILETNCTVRCGPCSIVIRSCRS
jgi:hypothetical protein